MNETECLPPDTFQACQNIINGNNILLVEREGKKQFERNGHRWENNVNIDRKQTG
jgi:hypothetical protein